MRCISLFVFCLALVVLPLVALGSGPDAATHSGRLRVAMTESSVSVDPLKAVNMDVRRVHELVFTSEPLAGVDPQPNGYAGIASEFEVIRKAHRTVLVDGKGFRDLGQIVRSERLLEAP
jgi:hypothetical protein